MFGMTTAGLRTSAVCALAALATHVSLSSQPASGRVFYAAPGGRAQADGSLSQPLDLQTALSPSSPLRAGDTLWLRGGRYAGAFVSSLTGSPSAPIVVRQYPGERATLDGAGSPESTLTINGGWTWYWGFELMDSDTKRETNISGSSPSDIDRGDGLGVFGPGVKLINLIVHDAADGIGFWTGAENAEIYGTLTYNNGWVGPDRGHGHGIYIQNRNGIKTIEDVISFNNFNTGMKAYAEASYAVGVRFQGVISFNNGSPTHGISLVREPNLFVGTISNPADAISITGSLLYHPAQAEANLGGSLVLGYSAQNRALTVTNNYVAGGHNAVKLARWSSVTMSDNFVHGALEGLTSASFPNNTFQTARPTGVRVFVRPNRYEAGRAHIAIYNWSLSSLVPVDASGVGLVPGDHIEVRDAQNYFGAPLVSETYTGAPVQIPMSGQLAAVPIGHSYTPLHTAPEFSAFVLIRTSGTATPPSPPLPPPTPPPPPQPQPSERWISILTPQVGTAFAAPAEITITADAGGPHAIRKIAFYSGTRLMGADSTRPFSYRWSRVPAGQHTIVVRSTDIKGVQVDTQMSVVVR